MRAVREADGNNGSRRPEWRTRVWSCPSESQVQIFAMRQDFERSSVWFLSEFAGKKQGTFLCVSANKHTHERKLSLPGSSGFLVSQNAEPSPIKQAQRRRGAFACIEHG